MKKLWIAAVAAGWAWAAQAGMGIVWSTCGWCVEAGGDANAGPGVAENNVVTWQLVYAGANNAPDTIDPSAAGWTGGDDVLLAERIVPAGGGSAADGTSWDSLLMQQGGDTTYEDLTWPAGTIRRDDDDWTLGGYAGVALAASVTDRLELSLGAEARFPHRTLRFDDDIVSGNVELAKWSAFASLGFRF